MADAITLFDKFVKTDLAAEVHNFTADTLKIALISTADNAKCVATTANINYTNFTKVTGDGYADVAVTDKQFSAGVLTGDTTVFTAGTAGYSAFRYYLLYNDSATNKEAICVWDHGTAGVTLAAAETFTINFNSDATDGTILTIATA